MPQCKALICVIYTPLAMHALTFLNHVLNFLAPAVFLSVLLALSAKLMWRKANPLINLWEQVLLNLVVGAVILGAGLVLSGRDGRLLTYAMLVLGMSISQWLMVRGWRSTAA
jgi:uncharacterized protein (DUF2062 family)